MQDEINGGAIAGWECSPDAGGVGVPGGAVECGIGGAGDEKYGAEMVLVAPRCDRHDPEALRMAVHGRDVLAAAREVATLPEALAGCQRIAVTLGRDTHAPIPLLPLREAMPWLAGGPVAGGPVAGGLVAGGPVAGGPVAGGPVAGGLVAGGPAASGSVVREQTVSEQAAIVFGREDHGLTNEELKYAQIAIQIPTSDAYPSLNLAQAIGICCYEFWLTQSQENPSPSVCPSFPKPISQVSKLSNKLDQTLSAQRLSGRNLLDQNLGELAPFETIEAYYQDLENLLQTVGFLYAHTTASRMAKLRHLGDRATLTAPDVAMLRGMLRQIRWAIAHLPRE